MSTIKYIITNRTRKILQPNKYQAVNGQLSTIGNTRMYTGREYDREILLSYHRARYYNANLGRFTSTKPYRDYILTEMGKVVS